MMTIPTNRRLFCSIHHPRIVLVTIGILITMMTKTTTSLAFQNHHHHHASIPTSIQMDHRRRIRRRFGCPILSPIPLSLSLPSSSSRCGCLYASNPSILIEEDTVRDISNMEQWAIQSGVVKADGITIYNTDEAGYDYGIATINDLSQGSCIVQIPSNVILSSNEIRKEFGGKVNNAMEYLRRLNVANKELSLFYLFLRLLVEYELGHDSPYEPWLNALPRLYYNSISMTDICYDCLPPFVLSLAKEERVKFDNFFAAVSKINFLSSETKIDEQLLKWAFNVVYTRSFYHTQMDDYKIVPMGDMFNHGSNEYEVQIEYDEQGNGYVFAIQDIASNSILRMNYGTEYTTNPSLLFAKYGFLDTTCTATYCKLMTIRPTEELYNLGYGTTTMLFYRETGEIAQEVWNVLLYDYLGSINKEQQNDFFAAFRNNDETTKDLYFQHYLCDIATILKEHVDSVLLELYELSQKASSQDVTKHPRIPMILQHNQFVQSTFLLVQERLDTILQQAIMMRQQQQQEK